MKDLIPKSPKIILKHLINCEYRRPSKMKLITLESRKADFFIQRDALGISSIVYYKLKYDE